MTVSLATTAFTGRGGQSIGLSQMLSVTAGGNPAYLVVTGLDRDEYTAGATDATGVFSGNGNSDSFTGQGSDFRGAGIVFTWNAVSGQYVNATYGALSQVQYTLSASTNDLVNIAFYGTSNLAAAQAYAANPWAMLELAEMGTASYIGSASVATQPAAAAAPAQATPGSIAAAAQSFVGQAWNVDGCWVLASSITTEAGAALPVTTTAVGINGLASGEWFVAYDGPVTASSGWESQVRAGEVVSFQTGSGGGHIVTVVSGSGSTAMIIDNAEFVNSNGSAANPANDGSANDIRIEAAHPFTQELGGVPASSVVVYELDTPIVTAATSRDTISQSASQSLATLFSAVDPERTAITEYQAYDAVTGDTFSAGGTTVDANSAAGAITASSLAAISFTAGSAAASDTIEVRAFNGSYWGDWTALSVSVTGAPPPPAPPVLAHQTVNQTWVAGQSVTLNLSSVFTDPANQHLTLSVTLANGGALPSTLHFNATTDILSGTAPITPETLGLKVTATDPNNLSTSEVFQATINPAPPRVLSPTASQTWRDGSTVSFTLPGNTFSDPLQTLHLAAAQISGANASSWLHFNPTTATLSGIVPTNATGPIGLAITGTDTVGQSASDVFFVQLARVSGHVGVG